MSQIAFVWQYTAVHETNHIHIFYICERECLLSVNTWNYYNKTTVCLWCEFGSMSQIAFVWQYTAVDETNHIHIFYICERECLRSVNTWNYYDKTTVCLWCEFGSMSQIAFVWQYTAVHETNHIHILYICERECLRSVNTWNYYDKTTVCLWCEFGSMSQIAFVWQYTAVHETNHIHIFYICERECLRSVNTWNYYNKTTVCLWCEFGSMSQIAFVWQYTAVDETNHIHIFYICERECLRSVNTWNYYDKTTVCLWCEFGSMSQIAFVWQYTAVHETNHIHILYICERECLRSVNTWNYYDKTTVCLWCEFGSMSQIAFVWQYTAVHETNHIHIFYICERECLRSVNTWNYYDKTTVCLWCEFGSMSQIAFVWQYTAVHETNHIHILYICERECFTF